MVNQEILGGLRHALNRGESLEKAMLSFYNAGYRKEEIEETAKFIQNPEQVQPTKKFETPSAIKSYPNKVSDYGAEKSKSNPIKKAGKWLLTAIIIIAIIFVGLLIAFLVAG